MMDVAVVVGAALLGVLVGPLLVLLVDRVPAMAYAGAPSPGRGHLGSWC